MTPATPLPKVVAHRGASVEAPENTLAAVRRAIARDADAVEVDVQRTRDGGLVMLHDTSLARTTDARRVFPRRSPWLVSDFTLDEVQQLDAGGAQVVQQVDHVVVGNEGVGEADEDLPEPLLAWLAHDGIVAEP